MATTVSAYELIKQGDFAFVDTGAPEGGEVYTTLVIIHGYAWHSGAFTELLPQAKPESCRIVLINRTDYPGSKVLGDEDIKLLAKDQADTVDGFQEFFRRRAQELVQFLARFAQEKNIPNVSEAQGGRKSGGIILTTWSFANYLLFSVLAYVGELKGDSVEVLKPYMRCLQIYDSPHHIFGYPEHPDASNPLSTVADPAEAARTFTLWVSAYWAHPAPDAEPPQLEFKTWVLDPPPTITTLSHEQIASAVSPASVMPDKADAMLYHAATGWHKPAFSAMRAKAFGEENLERNWPGVEVRWVWCAMTLGESPWAVWNMKQDIAAAKEAGRFARDVKFVKVEGANHFYHWDQPEQALRTLLSA